MAITDFTATELGKLIRQKELSPVEVVRAFLDRIEIHNSKWNAFVTINEHAIEEAKLVEEAVVKGEVLGKLHGIPIAIKDLTPTKGILTTYGSPLYKDYIPDYDPTFLKRIKAAGGIVLGKTNTPEFGHKGTTDNPLFGVTKNPWKETFTPGGSSGGSAAAVAAKLAPFAEGSDGGGSIRIPAALTGIFGFKPTFGVVPHEDRDNLFGSEHPYLHNGPMARTAEDAALLFSVMQGFDANNPGSTPSLSDDFTGLNLDLKGLKIAYTRNFGLYEISEDVEQVINQSVRHFSDLGCNVEEINMDLGVSQKDLAWTFSGLWCVKFAASYGELYDKDPESFSDGMAKMIYIGRKYSAIDYKALELKRTIIWKKVQAVLNEYDLLLSPTLATTAFDHQLAGPSTINGKSINPATDWMLTQIYNLTGHPAASMPVGLTRAGLPVGLQVAGNRFADKLVLEACHAYEKAFQTYIEPTYL
ncbi:amidase [Bacillus sp. FJAT-29814]|uniref:amidase n=1 Tax=Bacillus sp. FJAT-29814 TaxID=1729688 RepID=UPI000833BC12|nr:amidase [Bacillus sp. FJAT-29814]